MAWRLVVVLLALGVLGSGFAMAQEPVKAVTVHFDNEAVPLQSRASTVAGLLNELSIALPLNYQCNPPLHAALSDGMSVYLPGVNVTRGVTEYRVPIELQLMESWHYGPAKMQIIRPGCEGRMRVSLTLFFHDEQEVGRRQREEVLVPMVPREVICYRALGAGDGPSVEEILESRLTPGPHHLPPTRYREVLVMESTAYEPGPTSCGAYATGNTASGLKAGYGVVAVDPRVIPFGTRLFIENYGYAVAGDTGSAIKGSRIDVGFRTVEECYTWGRRQVRVYILY